jgi:hypothetical protein
VTGWLIRFAAQPCVFSGSVWRTVCQPPLPSPIYRKGTNGFRCEWATEIYVAFRSVSSSTQANRPAALRQLRSALVTQALAARARVMTIHSRPVRGSIRISDVK